MSPTGFVVALEVDKHRYICKDIADMSNTEFVLWLGQVFPLDYSKLDPDDYTTVETRVASLNNAISWHQLQFLTPRGNK